MLLILALLLAAQRPPTPSVAPTPAQIEVQLERHERAAKVANAERLILAGARVAEIDRQAKEIENFFQRLRRQRVRNSVWR